MAKFILTGANIYITLIFIILHIIIFIMFDGTINPEEELYQKIYWECRDSFLYSCVLYNIIMIMYVNLIMCLINGLFLKRTIVFFKGAVKSFVISQIVIIIYCMTKWYCNENMMCISAVFVVLPSALIAISCMVIFIWERKDEEYEKFYNFFARFSIINLAIIVGLIIFTIISLMDADQILHLGLYPTIILIHSLPILGIAELIAIILAIIMKLSKMKLLRMKGKNINS